jgi:hypothetical protein
MSSAINFGTKWVSDFPLVTRLRQCPFVLYPDFQLSVPPGLWRFLLRLPALEATVKGLDSILDIYSGVRSDAIPDQVPPFLPPSVADAREFCDHLLSALQRIEIGKKLGGISEDILGAYFFRVPVKYTSTGWSSA